MKSRAKKVGVKKDVPKKDLIKSPKTGKMILKSSYERLYGSKSEMKAKPQRQSNDEALPAALVKQLAQVKAELTPEELKYTLEKTTQPYLRRLLQAQIKKESDPRGKQTRGWASRAPQKGEPRRILHNACGDSAFLLPKDLKFPIMAKCGNGKEKGKCKCAIDCGGVRAALNRARQFGYKNVAAAAERLLETKCSKEPSTPKLIATRDE